MTPKQLLFILEKWQNCTFTKIEFFEDGSAVFNFFDLGGNKHKQILHTDGTVTHLPQ